MQRCGASGFDVSKNLKIKIKPKIFRFFENNLKFPSRSFPPDLSTPGGG